jgi:BlaI family penicillinase repressor
MDKRLLDAEWTILRAMWGRGKLSMREIVANVQSGQPEVLWHYKTYHTYLRLMLEKGLIGCEDKTLREKLYYPVITREEALRAESETVLARVSKGAMGSLLAMMAEHGSISDKDREDLKALAARMEETEGGGRG